MATLCRVHGFRWRISCYLAVSAMGLAGCATAVVPGGASRESLAGPGVILAVRDIPAADLTDQAGTRILSAISAAAGPATAGGRRVELVVRTQDGRIQSVVMPASAAWRPGAALALEQ